MMFLKKHKELPITYSYNDVSLVPAYSELTSRTQSNPEMHGYKLPIIGSCMDTLGKGVMEECIKYKVPFICHRAFKTPEEQLKAFLFDEKGFFTSSPNYNTCLWFAVGSVQKYRDWIIYLYNQGIRRFCVDMAHGDSLSCIDTIKFIKEYDKMQKKTDHGKYTALGFENIPVHVIAGNVATIEGFRRLKKAGADGVRVGIASGSICFTPETNVWFMSQEGKLYQKQIQYLKEGEKVLTADGRLRVIQKCFITDYSGEMYKINEDVIATPNHQFLTFNRETHVKEYIAIKDIDPKLYMLIDSDGKTYEINIDLVEYTGKVYNIEVEGDHTYCVGEKGFAVHNCSTSLECFPGDALISTNRGLIKISELDPSDLVLTHDGTYQKISSFFHKTYNGDMIEINGQLVTPDHEFFVVNKQDEAKINEDNYLKFGYWLAAKNITTDHLLIDLSTNPKMKLVPIKSIKIVKDFNDTVYNIGVDENNSYCVNGIIVHNCGMGVPILSNIMDIAPYKGKTWLIADGGCKHTGDISKAVYFGADFVMMGKMLAATDKALGRCYNKDLEPIPAPYSEAGFDVVLPHEFEDKMNRAIHLDKEFGNLISSKYQNMVAKNLVKYKEYKGMASRAARKNVLSYASVEGRSGLILYDTTTEQFLNDTFLRLQASLSYGGAHNWEEFRKNVKAVMRSPSGIAAAKTHLDVLFDK